MAGFSTRAVQVIEAFASGMGLPPQSAPDGSYNSEFSRSGTLSLAASDDGQRIVMCLARVPYRSDVALEKRFLDLAGLDPTSSTFVRAGRSPDGSMALAIDLEDRNFDAQSLDGTLRRLIDLHDSIA